MRSKQGGGYWWGQVRDELRVEDKGKQRVEGKKVSKGQEGRLRVRVEDKGELRVGDKMMYVCMYVLEQMLLFGWWAGTMTVRDVWRSSTVVPGALCVMTTGLFKTP